MEIKEAQQRYGDAIMQIINKYAAIVGSPKKMTMEGGIKILTKNTEIQPQKTKDIGR